ncbi:MULTISPECIES: hypothetical protein [unclassified Anabaena]|nr:MULTISPECIES: hypothetical protein [unclassified Anabaena]
MAHKAIICSKFERELEKDIADGKLEALAQEAIAEFQQGRSSQ